MFPDVGGSENKVFCAIPKRNWGERFDNKIVGSDIGPKSVESTGVADGLGADTEESVDDQPTMFLGSLKTRTELDVWTSDSGVALWESSSDSE